MKRILKIFLIGTFVLVAALVVNILVGILGISTWYDFIINVEQNGFFSAIEKEVLPSIVFLIFIYPLILGVVAVWSQKLMSRIIE